MRGLSSCHGETFKGLCVCVGGGVCVRVCAAAVVTVTGACCWAMEGHLFPCYLELVGLLDDHLQLRVLTQAGTSHL